LNKPGSKGSPVAGFRFQKCSEPWYRHHSFS